MAKFSVSERFACKVLGQHRSTHRKKPGGRKDDAALTADIVRLASRYGRYGYRRITAMLRSEGWTVNAKRVERIWRREGLKVPQKQPKRGRLWLNDGSCIRLRPEYPNHVWSYDFVEGRTHDGRKFRMLNIIDEFTRECLAIRLARKLNSTDVIDALSDLFILRGVPGHVRSDNVLRAEGNEAGNQSLSVRQHSRCMALVKLRNRTRRLPPLKEEVSSIANRVRVLAALTVLNTSF
jgi:transposase InsO family protein